MLLQKQHINAVFVLYGAEIVPETDIRAFGQPIFILLRHGWNLDTKHSRAAGW